MIKKIIFPGLISLLVISGLACQKEPKKVEALKHGDGQWQLMVDGEPFFIKGVLYGFSVVGDDPDLATLRDWAILDLDNNGAIDVAYDSWVDANHNNRQDAGERRVGDWQLLKDMGANTIRVYQMPSADERLGDIYFYPQALKTFFHEPNKAIFRDLAERYGIMVIVGHFFGEWAIGSQAPWEDGTDYTDPKQRENLLTCIRVMVEEHKDEPYTLMWVLGNENFNPYDHDNAEDEVEAFLTLVNEAAQMIHEMDPNHPVALCNWDMAHIKDIARWAPAVDIYGLNSYRWGFNNIFKEVKENFDRPVMLTEYGHQAKFTHIYDEGAQARYHKDCWKTIWANRFEGSGVGNSIGGVIFSWCDQWHLGDDPWLHDTGSFLDVPGSEWFGITAQGDGAHSPYLRQLRKAYFIYKDLWGGTSS